jgi:endonuclease/exonuclease/phosphatase family metal-dependent hydrolase
MNVRNNLFFTLAFWGIAFNIFAQKPTPIPFAQSAFFPSDYTWNQDTLTLISWNVEHFTDPHDNPYINHTMEDSTRVTSEKIDLFVKALIAFNADVVLLQEFESAAFASALAKKHFEQLGYRFITGWENKDWYMNVVILSRVPIGVVEGYGNVYTATFYPNESGDTIYEVQSMLNDRMWNTALWPNEHTQLFITGVHLKAGRRPRDKAMRIGQLDFIKSRFHKMAIDFPDAPLILAGDLNCIHGSDEFKFVTAENGKATLRDYLPADAFSHPSDHPQYRLDYILLNDAGSKRTGPTPIQVLQPLSPKEMRVVSDHLPLQLRIFVGEKR